MNRCILNVAVGAWYPKGQRRMVESLPKVGYRGGLLLWGDEQPEKYPPGSPPHQVVPYAFKVYALEEAQRQGHRYVLWADASVWFIRNPKPFYDALERDGYWISYCGFMTGQWCADHALAKLGVTREEAFGMPMVAATFFGLDLESEPGKTVMQWMSAHARDGSFVGPWTNKKSEASKDPRVSGHRHDQTALSVVWNRLGLKMHVTPMPFEIYCGGDYCDHVVAYAAGM